MRNQLLDEMVWSALEGVGMPLTADGLYTVLIADEGLDFVDKQIGSPTALATILKRLVDADRAVGFHSFGTGPAGTEYTVTQSIPTVAPGTPVEGAA